MRLTDLVSNSSNNRRVLIALVLILPMLLFIVMGVTFSVLFPNRHILESFYNTHLLNQLTIILAPLLAGAVVSLPLLWETYRKNQSNLWSSKSAQDLVRPQNYLAIILALIAFGLAAFVPLHDSVHCFTGLPVNGWDWFVECVRTS